MARPKLDKDLVVSKETGGLDLAELEVFRKNLRKEFGNSTALDDDDFVTSFISTGIDPLDYLLGGGLPQGKMSEIVGLEGTGKSSFGIHMLGLCFDRSCEPRPLEIPGCIVLWIYVGDCSGIFCSVAS